MAPEWVALSYEIVMKETLHSYGNACYVGYPYLTLIHFLPVSRARGLDSWNKIVLFSEWYPLSNDTD